jgi:hypothetical protein
MSAEVVAFTGATVLPIAPENVLQAAAAAGYEAVFVVGRLPSGDIDIAASDGDSGFNIWMLRRAIRMLDAIDDAKFEQIDGAA